jgi:hypothetical protein
MWNTISSSKLLKAIEDEKVRIHLIQALLRHEKGKATVKRAVDVEAPNQPEFMRQNKKRKVLRQFYNHKVFYENNLLLKKLNDINKKKELSTRTDYSQLTLLTAEKQLLQNWKQDISSQWLAEGPEGR